MPKALRRALALLVPSLILLPSCSSSTGSAEALTVVEGEDWDLVWFSDSTGWGVAELWGAAIEERFGVEVEVHDYAVGSLPAARVLGWIEDGPSSLPKLRDLVSQAEIIVINGNPVESGSTTDIGTCVSTSTEPRDTPSRNTAEDWAPYREVLETIYETVFGLMDGQAAVVVAMDFYNPVIADWRMAGIEVGCTAAWEMMTGTVAEAADVFNVPTVSMYDAFNGIDHSEDPREKGYIGFDGEHTNDHGKAAMVQVLMDSGLIRIEDN